MAATIHDYLSGSPVPIQVDLTWTATSETFHEGSSYSIRSPQYSATTHATGSGRDAQAAGTILVANTNVTPQPSSLGVILSSQSGTITRDR